MRSWELKGESLGVCGLFFFFFLSVQTTHWVNNIYVFHLIGVVTLFPLEITPSLLRSHDWFSLLHTIHFFWCWFWRICSLVTSASVQFFLCPLESMRPWAMQAGERSARGLGLIMIISARLLGLVSPNCG